MEALLATSPVSVHHPLSVIRHPLSSVTCYLLSGHLRAPPRPHRLSSLVRRPDVHRGLPADVPDVPRPSSPHHWPAAEVVWRPGSARQGEGRPARTPLHPSSPLLAPSSPLISPYPCPLLAPSSFHPHPFFAISSSHDHPSSPLGFPLAASSFPRHPPLLTRHLLITPSLPPHPILTPRSSPPTLKYITQAVDVTL